MRAVLLLLLRGVLLMALYDTGASYVGDWSFARHGPVYHGDDIYVIAEKGSAGITAFKSSDGGQTWTEADSGNEPNDTGEWFNMWSIDWWDDTIRVYYTSGDPEVLAVCDFDMETDTWGAEDISSVATTGSTYGGVIGKYRATDDSDIILYQAPEVGGLATVNYVIRTQTSPGWQAPVKVNSAFDTNQAVAVGVCLGASDMAYLFFQVLEGSSLYFNKLPFGGSIYNYLGDGWGERVTNNLAIDGDGNGWAYGPPLVIDGYVYVPVSEDYGFATSSWLARARVARTTDDTKLPNQVSWTVSNVDDKRPSDYGWGGIGYMTMVDVVDVPWCVFIGSNDARTSWTWPTPVYASRYRTDISPEGWEDATEVVEPLASDDSYYGLSAAANADGTGIGILLSYGTHLYFTTGTISAAASEACLYRIS